MATYVTWCVISLRHLCNLLPWLLTCLFFFFLFLSHAEFERRFIGFHIRPWTLGNVSGSIIRQQSDIQGKHPFWMSLFCVCACVCVSKCLALHARLFVAFFFFLNSFESFSCKIFVCCFFFFVKKIKFERSYFNQVTS